MSDFIILFIVVGLSAYFGVQLARMLATFLVG